MRRSLLRWGVIPHRRMRQRGIEAILRRLERCRRRPQQGLRVPRCIDRRRKLSGKQMRLQLSRPVIELREHEIRAVGQTALGIVFAISLMIQAAERFSQPAQGEDQTKLCSAALDERTKAHPPRKCQALLAFLLHFLEWIPGSETYRVGQQFALGCQIFDREDKPVIALPSLFCKKGAAGPEIDESHSYAVESFARRPAIRFNS